jgi:hypothetical protein
MSRLPMSSSKHSTAKEDQTLIELSLFSELIKDDSVIDSMIRALRYERNRRISRSRSHNHRYTLS